MASQNKSLGLVKIIGNGKASVNQTQNDHLRLDH